MKTAVKLTGITKRFGDVIALDQVDLQVQEGCIHAVVGENGAGKTTLMKVLYGSHQPDSGSIEVFEQATTLKNSARAIARGIGMVSQHYGIIPEISCLQNLILGAEGGALISLPAAESRAQELALKMGFDFEWHRDAAELSPAGAQKLEILKLLWRNSRIMILDEPTAMLSPADGQALFQSLQKLVQEGNTVILVTHRLPEVFEYCARVTVLRGGKWIADKAVAETNPAELAELIVGKRLEAPLQTDVKLGEPVLTTTGVSVKGYRGNLAVKDVDLTIRSGEVVGIAGVDGSGQRELFHALMGTTPVQLGKIVIGGQDKTNDSSRQRLFSGISVIPEDRHEEAVIEDWSLEENAALGAQRAAPFAKGNLVQEAARRVAAKEISDRFHTRHGGIQQPISSLSGGNQQRFVAARALHQNPKLLLAFQPTRGLDLSATQDVYQGIRDACAIGAGALVVSYDLDELLEHCDRIVVMNGGTLTEPRPEDARNPDVIGRLMVGVK